MSELGFLRGIAGAARGINRGLDEREEDARRAREEARRDRQEQRSEESHRQSMEQGAAQERRAQEDHAEQMRGAPGRARAQELQLERAERDKRKADFDERWDAAAGAFAASGGANYKDLEKLYNEHFPDGNDVAITRDERTGRLSMDFGDGQVLQNLSPEAVYGMAMQMKDPETYYKTIEGEKARKQRKEDQKEMIDYRLARTPKKPGRATVMVDDNGNPVAFDPDTMTMKPLDAGGATFKNGGRVGRGGQVLGGRGAAVPAEIQAIDAYAQKLPPVAGESDGDRWIRAAKTRAQLVGKNDPDAAVRQFDAALRGKLMSDPSIANNPERAKKIDAYVTQQVEDFQKRWVKPQAPADGVAAPGVDDAEDPLGLFKVTPPGVMP